MRGRDIVGRSAGAHLDVSDSTGCQHLPAIVDEIKPCLEANELEQIAQLTGREKEVFIDEVAKRNVQRTALAVVQRSKAISEAISRSQVMVVGAIYDVKTGAIEFLPAVVGSETGRVA